MDDKPTIEYHPFGTITLNFDEVAVKLRRCRLGDLQFAKDLLEELRTEINVRRQAAIDEIDGLRVEFRQMSELIQAEDRKQTDEETALVRERSIRINQLGADLDSMRVDLTYGWFEAVVKRMGDNSTPPKEEWPIELLLSVDVITSVIAHWQSRPLASGRTSPNGTIREAATSTPSPPDPSYPPAQLPQ